ncbi:hypothetical protein BH11PSE6_BH11PSE6_07250 [soil metagenome]
MLSPTPIAVTPPDFPVPEYALARSETNFLCSITGNFQINPCYFTIIYKESAENPVKKNENSLLFYLNRENRPLSAQRHSIQSATNLNVTMRWHRGHGVL